MNIKEQIYSLDLDESNAVVIGSGIFEVLGIRKCSDIDLVVSEEVFETLSSSGIFNSGVDHGVKVLENDIFDIRTDWIVFGKSYSLSDLQEESEIIDGVRYINLEFYLKVKEFWVINDEKPRQKDFQDIALVKEYLSNNK